MSDQLNADPSHTDPDPDDRPVKLSVEGLRKEFEDVLAVDDVDVRIYEGEFLALLGPSGSGKTTLLHLIAGLESPTAGRIRLDGTDVTDLPAEDRDIGLIFQNLALFRKLTVAENLGFVPSINGASKAAVDRTVREVAATVGLDESLLDRRADRLNPNEQQRVAIGRSIVAEPSLLLLDEPMDNLDEHQAINMRGELKKLQHRLTQTMVYVTHDQTEAMSLADRIVVMHHGRIQQIGSPRDLYRRPVNEFIAGFIGSPSMNFFDGSLAPSGLAVLDAEVPFEALARSREHLDRLLDDGSVRVGIRPEDLRYEPTDVELAFTGTLTELEPTGAEELLHGEASGEAFTLLTSRRTGLAPGDRFTAGASANDLSLVDPRSGEVVY